METNEICINLFLKPLYSLKSLLNFSSTFHKIDI